jgi:hypothetical protein
MCILLLLSKGVDFKKEKIVVGNKKMDSFIADTPRKMTVGLMFRNGLKSNECMTFFFPNDGTHPIWMRNMKFPIDIVWYDSNKRVVDFVENAMPSGRFDFSSFRPKKPARYVIEFNAGFVKKNKIKIKDVAKFGI